MSPGILATPADRFHNVLEWYAKTKRAYEDWDRQMLPIPPEARRAPWQHQVDRARNLDPVRRP